MSWPDNSEPINKFGNPKIEKDQRVLEIKKMEGFKTNKTGEVPEERT